MFHDINVGVNGFLFFKLKTKNRFIYFFVEKKLYSETWCWTILKIVKRICHLCDMNKVEDEKYYIFECHACIHIKLNFKILVTIATFLTL